MQTEEALRKRIRSAEDLYAIVKTMKTLSAVNIRHYEKAVESVSDYYQTVELGLQVVLKKGAIDVLTRSADKDSGTGIVIFGSDQGLCGGFNDQIVSFALEKIYDSSAPEEKNIMLCVGSRAGVILEEKAQPVREIYSVPNSFAGIVVMVQQILTVLNEMQETEDIHRIVFFYNRLLSTVSYKPSMMTLLPLDREKFESIAGKKWPNRVLPTFTMNRNALFSALVREYLFVSLFRAFAESMASENAARLSSMQAAEKNIEERLEEFNALYRHQRQSNITSELFDIVSGFEALMSEGEKSSY